MSSSRRLFDFSNVIGRLYEAAADSAAWPQALGAVCGHFNAAAGMLHWHEAAGDGTALFVEYPSACDAPRLSIERYTAANPIVTGLARYDVGAIFQIRADRAESPELRSYRDWVCSRGYRELLGTVVYRDERYFAALGLARRADGRAYGADDVEMVELVAGHVRRALRIGEFAQRWARDSIFERVLDRISSAVIVIDDHANVHFHNAAARDLFDDRSIGCVDGGRLILAALPVSDLVEGVRANQVFVAALAAAGPVLGLTAFALREAPDHPIAIFISGERTPVRALPALLATAFALTGAELRVLLALLEGQTPNAIAERYGIAVTTVRTHVANLFEKTKASGQLDLVRKAAAILPAISIPTC